MVRAACAFPALTVAGALALAVLSAWYTLTTLTFATSNRALLPQGRHYIERFTAFEKDFGELEDLVIVVEARSLAEAKAYDRRLAQALREQQVPLRRVTYRIDPQQFEGRALLYLSKESSPRSATASSSSRSSWRASRRGPRSISSWTTWPRRWPAPSCRDSSTSAWSRPGEPAI